MAWPYPIARPSPSPDSTPNPSTNPNPNPYPSPGTEGYFDFVLNVVAFLREYARYPPS